VSALMIRVVYVKIILEGLFILISFLRYPDCTVTGHSQLELVCNRPGYSFTNDLTLVRLLLPRNTGRIAVLATWHNNMAPLYVRFYKN